MARHHDDTPTDTGNAGPALPSAGRSQLDEFPLNDTTSIRHGAQAVIGRYTWSASQMSPRGEALALYDRTQKVAADREAREMANLAAWNAQMTMVGGVRMTNEEAQEARRRVIEHDDAYADWAVAEGHIGADDKDGFKRGVRRKMELEDRRGRGILTEDEAREAEALDRSRIGKAIDAATARDHQKLGIAPRSADAAPITNEAVRGGAPSPLDEYTLFQAVQGKQPNTAPGPAAPSKAVQATGLDL